mmetsp:Transcript_32358/g.81634  ORF Transcript_32358/g.81634 Transcript_32358/m.81634 type:complete len:206 (-) Transcript_32358:2754-3371(-)
MIWNDPSNGLRCSTPPRRCGPCRAWQAAQSSTPSLQFQAKPPPSAHEPTCRLCCQNGRSSLCKPRRRLGHCARRRSPGPAVSPPAVAAARAAAAAPTPGSYRRTRHRSCKLGRVRAAAGDGRRTEDDVRHGDAGTDGRRRGACGRRGSGGCSSWRPGTRLYEAGCPGGRRCGRCWRGCCRCGPGTGEARQGRRHRAAEQAGGRQL